MATLDSDGREILDPTPMAPPVGYKKQKTLAEQIREMVLSEKLKAEMEAQGAESFEEADDFDVDDDFDPHTPYENEFDPPIAELNRQEAEANSKAKAKKSAVDKTASVIDPAKPVDPKPAT